MEEGGSSTTGNNVKQEAKDEEESSGTSTGSDYDSSPSPLNSSIDKLSSFSKHLSKRKEGLQISADNSPKSTKRKEPGTGSTQKTAADLSDDCIGEAARRFTSHMLNLKAGEDVVENIVNLSRACKRQSVIILSASGTVSNVTLRVPDGGDASFTYQGIFHLLSLSGSYIFTTKPARGQRRRKEMLFSILMSDFNGNVFGGSIANSLIAAGPLQVVVGTFTQDGLKEPRKIKESNESSHVIAAPPPKVSGGNSNAEKIILGEDSKILVEGQTNCPSPTSGFLPTTGDDQAATHDHQVSNNQAATHDHQVSKNQAATRDDQASKNQAATHDHQVSNNQTATHDDQALNTQAATHDHQAANSQATTHDVQAAADNQTAIHDDQAAYNQTATHDDQVANNLDNNSSFGV